MDARNNFEPLSNLIQEDECDTLVVFLPGFTKEQLRVQLTNQGALRITGSRPDGERRLSFEKNFPISGNIATNKISAKFEGGILYVRQPKLIVPADKEGKKDPPSETAKPQKPGEAPLAPKIDQQAARPEKTTPPIDDQGKKTGGKDSQIKEEKPTKENEKSTDEKDEKKNQQEKSDRADINQKNAGRTTSDEHKKVAGNTDADLADKKTKYHDRYGDYNNRYAGFLAPKLKMSGQTVKMILVVLFGVLLGMYLSKLSWFSRNNGN